MLLLLVVVLTEPVLKLEFKKLYIALDTKQIF